MFMNYFYVVFVLANQVNFRIADCGVMLNIPREVCHNTKHNTHTDLIFHHEPKTFIEFVTQK